MRTRERIGLVLILVLGWSASALAMSIAEHYQTGGRLRLELGRARLTRLEPATIARLESLEAKVLVTYYVSRRDEMPSDMRHVERQVTDLLEALRARAPERFDFLVVDPATDPELAGFAARRKIAPFRVKSFAHDSYSERTVWSALSISYGAHPEAILSGIGPAQIPALQRTLVRWLDQLEHPRRPVIAFSAPPGFDELADSLAERGEVVRTRPDQGEPLPDADVLFWMNPRRTTDETLAELDRFLENGGSVVLAGGRLAADARSLVAAEDGGPALQLFPSGSALPELLPHFGLQPRPGLFLDERCDTLEFQDEEYQAPFLIRCIAPNQDFHSFPLLPNGTLLFTAPTPLALDDDALRAGGWTADVLATTSEKTWGVLEPVPPAPPLPLAAMVPDERHAVAKQPLIVGLRPDQPWHGLLIACAATTPFEDGLLHRENVAHPRLLSALLSGTTSDERLVMRSARVERPAPLPPMDWRERAVWRLFCVFALPGLLLVVGLRRGLASGPRARRERPTARPWALAPAVALLLALALVRVGGSCAPRWDATSGRLNALAHETVRIAERAGELGPVTAELVLSDRQDLPPDLRALVPRLEDLLARLQDTGADLELERVRPADLDTDARAALEDRSPPFRSATKDGDVTTVRRFHASLVLSRGEHSETVGFPDARAFEELEARLAFALWKLNAGRAPHVAFASDVPRLSAAEAYEHYQQKGSFAPKGTDVYSLARETLEREGFRVTHVDPSDPVMPDDVDLLVWMQPRRSTEPMLEATLRYLLGGGHVLLAAQHFNILSQQFRGADFDFRYWPRPQSPDVEYLYFPELSIDLVREVLFDELSTRIQTEVEITGMGPNRVFEQQTSALPFLIRAAAASFDHESLVTRDLGDQAFVWGNYLRWDPARLAELGLSARVLMTTSARTWTYAWTGGYLPDELLAGPPRDASGAPQTLGELPLAVLFEGAFPKPVKPLKLHYEEPEPLPEEAPADESPSGAEEQAEKGVPPTGVVAPGDEEPAVAWPEPLPGKLLFVGCSELFKDHRLLDPEFRGDQFLWNAAAALALEPELAEVMTRRRAEPGFGYVEPRTKLLWRAYVVGAGPLALVLVGAGLGLLRRRPSHRLARAGGSRP